MTNTVIPFREFNVLEQAALPLEIVYIPDSATIRNSDFTRPQRPNFYEIMFIVNAEGTRTIDFTTYSMQPNSLFFLTPGQVHYWTPSPGVEVDGYVLIFPEEFLHLGALDSQYLSNLDFFQPNNHNLALYLSDAQAADIQSQIATIEAELQSNLPGQAQMLQSLVQRFLLQAQRYYQASHPPVTPSVEKHIMEQFRRLIEEHFLVLRCVQDYADQLNITAGALTKIARTTTGRSAGSLIRERLLIEAKRLLAHTDQSVAKIAVDLNFDDPSYFGRFFKRETGLSPMTFRQSFRQKYQRQPN